MKKIIIPLFLTVLFASNAIAQDTNYASLDLNTLLEMSSNGDACATDAIGDCYALGRGGAKIDNDVATICSDILCLTYSHCVESCDISLCVCIQCI